jgi:hypothetical protein
MAEIQKSFLWPKEELIMYVFLPVNCAVWVYGVGIGFDRYRCLPC